MISVSDMPRCYAVYIGAVPIWALYGLYSFGNKKTLLVAKNLKLKKTAKVDFIRTEKP